MPVPFIPKESADWYRRHYATQGSRGMARMLQVSASKVLKDMRHHGIDIDPQSPWANLKRDYFDTIDTPEKAYLLGFIAADGTVSRSTCQMRIRLAEEDRGHLETIREELNAAPLRTAPQPEGRQPSAVLCVSAIQIVDALIALGVTENKDNVLGPVANIDPPFDRHFVRGLVDGDGTLKLVKAKFPRIEFKNRNAHLRAAVRRYWESLGVAVQEYSWQGKYPVIYCNSCDSVIVARIMYLSDAAMALPRKVERARVFQRYSPRRQDARTPAHYGQKGS